MIAEISLTSATVFWDVTGASRDILKNGCRGDYAEIDLSKEIYEFDNRINQKFVAIIWKSLQSLKDLLVKRYWG